MPIYFKQIQNEKLRTLLKEVYSQYPKLQDASVVIEKKRIKGVTMRALPVVTSLIWPFGQRKYKIQMAEYVRDSKKKKVEDLDPLILEGWIAHELGHVMDYHKRGFWKMLLFGLRYWLDSDFARTVEHEADRIAVKHGFLPAIIATKKFLFYSPEISIHYRSRLEALYMSIEEVKLCVPENQRVL